VSGWDLLTSESQLPLSWCSRRRLSSATGNVAWRSRSAGLFRCQKPSFVLARTGELQVKEA